MLAPQAVGGELLALRVSVYTREVFYQSKGFGSEEEEIVWQEVPSQVLKDIPFAHSMCSIQLGVFWTISRHVFQSFVLNELYKIFGN